MRGSSDPEVVRARVVADEPERAIGALAEALGPSPSLLFVFASWRLDPDAVAAALDRRYPGVPIVGCTSNGEIAAGGDAEGSVVGLAVRSSRLRVGLGIASDLEHSALRSSRAAVAAAADALGTAPEQLQPSRHVGVALVDGRSGHEESFCLGSAATAPQIKLVGGSASDAYAERARACVFFDGKAHAGAGVVALLETDLPFAVIESEHMLPTEIRVVVTAAEPERRRILELDGRPAVKRYAELIGSMAGGPLDAQLASTYPFALYVGGRPYVRSVAEIEGDALLMASAVDPGTILRLMRPGDLVGSTRAALDEARAEVGGELRAVVAFSCLGRHREALAGGHRGALGEIYDHAPLVGFHSFGEQKGPLLVNHTLTGLALGAAHG